MLSPASSDGAVQIVSRNVPVHAFANALSGGGKSRKLLPAVAAAFQAHGLLVDISETSCSDDLEKRAQNAIQNGAQTLFAMGGDGTLQSLVNAAYGHDVVLGVIPVGGGNDFARALHLPADPIAAVFAALSGAPRAVDVARVSTGDGRKRFYLGAGGIGLEADAAKFANAQYKKWPGRLRYVGSAIEAYSGYKPLRVRVVCEDCREPAPWCSAILVSVLNTPTFGAGIKLAPEARIDDGLLDFVFLKELRFGRLLRILPNLAFRGTLNLPQLSRKRVCKLRIETETPAFFQADGELIGPTPVEIEVVPAAVRFLAPPPAKF